MQIEAGRRGHLQLEKSLSPRQTADGTGVFQIFPPSYQVVAQRSGCDDRRLQE